MSEDTKRELRDPDPQSAADENISRTITPHDSLASEALHSQWQQYLDYYQAQGVPSGLLSKGCISQREAEVLHVNIRESGAKRVLEIGTFVGASTLVLAGAVGSNGSVLTVDPGFPMLVQSREFGIDDERECLTLARDAAIHFGFAERVAFSRGYSAQMPGKEMQHRLEAVGVDWRLPGVVAHDIQSWGRIDFAFVDGEHSASGVLNDLTLLNSQLRDEGAICLHDVQGRWATDVLDGIAQFLQHVPNYEFSVDRNLGFLRKTNISIL